MILIYSLGTGNVHVFSRKFQPCPENKSSKLELKIKYLIKKPRNLAMNIGYKI